MTCPTCERIFASELARCPIDGASLIAGSARRTDELAIGQVVGEYIIEAAIGRGGMGVVYRATHPTIGSRVAIKVIAHKHGQDASAVARFVREARAANRIRHRAIVDVFALGQLPDGRVYCVMEYLDGISLARHLGAVRRMPLDEALCVLEQVARALDASHAKGVVHRDVKPGNIYLVRDHETGQLFVKLLDFGIAKLVASPEAPSELGHTRTGTVIGTPSYMSPEQCRGKDVGPATDIYALGVVAYQVLTGTLPFEAENVADLHVQQHTRRPEPMSTRVSGVHRDVDAVIARALHLDADQRYATATSFVRALAAAASHSSVTVATAIDRAARAGTEGVHPKRRSLRWAVGGCALAIAVAIAVVAALPPPAVETQDADVTAAPASHEVTVERQALVEASSDAARVGVEPTPAQHRPASPSKPARAKPRPRRVAPPPPATTPPPERPPSQNPSGVVPARKLGSSDVIADMPVRF